jgi:hypothetical protein
MAKNIAAFNTAIILNTLSGSALLESLGDTQLATAETIALQAITNVGTLNPPVLANRKNEMAVEAIFTAKKFKKCAMSNRFIWSPPKKNKIKNLCFRVPPSRLNAGRRARCEGLLGIGDEKKLRRDSKRGRIAHSPSQYEDPGYSTQELAKYFRARL